MDELLEGEFEVPGLNCQIVMTGREWSADQIVKVGALVAIGSYPQELSAFDLGRALGRALTNCNEDDPVKELLRGIEHYKQRKATGSDDRSSADDAGAGLAS